MQIRLPLLSFFTTCAVLLSGCAGNQTEIMQQSDFNGVSKPGQVFVGQFAYATNDPNPDQSILNRMNNQFAPSSPQTPEDQAGFAVAQKMQNSLIKDLNHEGIVSVATLNNVVPQVGSLLIEGEILTVKDAASFQRISPGLTGAGRAKVVSFVSVYLVTPNGVTSFAKFYSDTQTSVQPDVATTLAVGAAAGGVEGQVGSNNVDTLTSRSQSAQSDAKLIAKQIAKKMGKLFKAESWTSPTSPN
jgi:hypothetical protein